MSGFLKNKGLLIGISAFVLVVILPVVVMGGLLGILFPALFGAATNQMATACGSAPTVQAASVAAGTGAASEAYFNQFSPAIQAEQVKNVGLIKGIGKSLGASTKDIEVAVAVAIQETHLQNLPGGDRDSRNLYQQRPSIINTDGTPYWGTPEQLAQPEYAIRRFYDELFKFGGREDMSLVAIGIMVQNPDPAAYYSTWAWDTIAKELVAGESGVGVANGTESQILADFEPICEKIPQTVTAVAIDAVISEVGQVYERTDGETNGFDGSGLTSQAYSNADVALPMRASEQYNVTKKVDRNELIPGDLVYWAENTENPETINRVAMWVGENQIIEAPEAHSKIRLIPMHWDGFIGATRPIPEPAVVEGKSSGASGEWQHPITPGLYSNSSGYGWRKNPLGGADDLHNGTDLAASCNTPIYSVSDGTILSFETFGGNGGVVTWIQHGDGIVTGYAHQNQRADGISIGATVKAGDIIGYVGSTGGSTGCHLHLMVVTDWASGKTIEPLQFMRERGVNL